MDALIGPRGQMVPFKCPSALQSESAQRSTLLLTLGGRQKEQRGPRGRRVWSVDIGTATPDEIAHLAALVDGFYGPPPWVWVDPFARVTNLLSPSASVLGVDTWGGTKDQPTDPPSATLGGAGVTSDGMRFGRSVLIKEGQDILFGYRNMQADYFPLRSGIPFSASFYGSGTGNVRVDMFDANGLFIDAVNGPSTSGSWTRRTVTGTPPTNATSGQLRSNGVTTGTLPCVSWTAEAGPWAHGRGCNRVTIDGLSEAVQLASETDPGSRRSSISFTVIELG